MKPARILFMLSAAILVCACATPATPQLSARPSASGSDAGDGPLPAGCEPIALVTTEGERLELDGIWVQDEGEERRPMTWWIRTSGDCLWGTGVADNFPSELADRRPDDVQNLTGTLRQDFTIASEVVWLGTHPAYATPQYYAEVDLIIEPDADGVITLREDREPGVEGPHCPQPLAFCPAPLLLRPAGAAGS